MSFDRGKLRHYVTIEHKVNVLDSGGNVVQNPQTGEIETEWLPLATTPNVWAEIRPLSAREFIAAQQTQSQVNCMLTIEYRSDLDASMRIVDEFGTIYNPAGLIPDPVSNREWLTIPASYGVNAG